MKLRHLGIFGIISLLSYTAMVVFSPLALPRQLGDRLPGRHDDRRAGHGHPAEIGVRPV